MRTDDTIVCLSRCDILHDRTIHVTGVLHGGTLMAGNGFIHGVKGVGLDSELVAVEGDDEFTKVLAVLAGLDHRRA